MSETITLEELLKLVTVEWDSDGEWHIIDVKGDVDGDVYGYVGGSVGGYVFGRIKGREWQYIETPKERLGRLIKATGSKQLLEAFNQLEDN